MNNNYAILHQLELCAHNARLFCARESAHAELGERWAKKYAKMIAEERQRLGLDPQPDFTGSAEELEQLLSERTL